MTGLSAEIGQLSFLLKASLGLQAEIASRSIELQNESSDALGGPCVKPVQKREKSPLHSTAGTPPPPSSVDDIIKLHKLRSFGFCKPGKPPLQPRSWQ